MARYYCPQVHSLVQGWVDVPMGASLKQKEAEGFSLKLAKGQNRVTRVIRKPHGWAPVWEEASEAHREVFEDPPGGEDLEEEREPRVALGRKHEKHRTRLQAMRPTALERVLRDVLGEEE